MVVRDRVEGHGTGIERDVVRGEGEKSDWKIHLRVEEGVVLVSEVAEDVSRKGWCW